MNIFSTTFESVWSDSVRALYYTLLLKLAGDSADRFECLKPLPSQNVLGKTRECRKADYVQLLIAILQAGADASVLPAGCSCEQLAGSLCGWSESGFQITVGAINAIVPEAEG